MPHPTLYNYHSLKSNVATISGYGHTCWGDIGPATALTRLGASEPRPEAEALGLAISGSLCWRRQRKGLETRAISTEEPEKCEIY